MKSIDNAWKVPLSRGGIFKIIINKDSLEIYRIFSGKYIEEKLHLRKDMDYIDSLIVPGATDPVEPEDLYNDLKNMIKTIFQHYNSNQSAKIQEIDNEKDSAEYRKIKFADIHDISISVSGDEKFPELALNGDRYILPSKNFLAFSDEDRERYEEYKNIVDRIRKQTGKM